MENPLVSVVTPVYNHGRYIGQSIQSLLAQTYTNWEMVVVDDGSTDNTAEVVQSFSDPRITYMYQENRGVRELAGTINTGLRKTSGELVTMLPSDDTWPNCRLEKQVPVFRDSSVVLCFGRQSLIDENNNIVGEVRPPADLSKVENRPVGSALHEMFLSNFIPQPTVLIRRAALDQIGGYLQPPGLLAEDYPTQMALALLGEFRYLDLPLANYRMHEAQMTRQHYLEMV
ncbi:MAG TPA: glycosyltransferase, partial [Thermoleophilia bacterium]|nr:glycosyltransferase [Thermoleophilia bacterium]